MTMNLFEAIKDAIPARTAANITGSRSGTTAWGLSSKYFENSFPLGKNHNLVDRRFC